MANDIRKLQLAELEILKEFLRICKKYRLRYFALGGTLLGAIRHQGFIPWDDDVDVGMPRADFEHFRKIAPRELPEHFRLLTWQGDTNYRYYVPRLVDSRVKVIDTSAITPVEKDAWIDIFPLDGMPGGERARKLHCFRLLAARMRVNFSMFSTNVDVRRRDRPLHERLLIGAGRVLPVERLFDSRRELRRLDRLMRKYTYDDSPWIINFMGVHKLKEMFRKRYYGQGFLYDFEDIRIRGPVDADVVLTQMYGDYHSFPDEEERNHHHTQLKE